MRKKLFRFITLSILFAGVNYGFDYVFRPTNIDVYRELSIALGLTFGMSFLSGALSHKRGD